MIKNMSAFLKGAIVFPFCPTYQVLTTKFSTLGTFDCSFIKTNNKKPGLSIFMIDYDC